MKKLIVLIALFTIGITQAQRVRLGLGNPTASEIANIPLGSLSSTDLQGVANELQGDIDAINLSLATALVSGDLNTFAELQALVADEIILKSGDNASLISFTPTNGLTSNTLDAVISELKDLVDASVGGTSTDDQNAGEVDIADAGGFYTSLNAEGAFQEIGGELSTIASAVTNSEISSITFDPTTNILTTNEGGNAQNVDLSALAGGGTSTDDQNATEVDLSPAIDIDNDGTDETNLQESVEKLKDVFDSASTSLTQIPITSKIGEESDNFKILLNETGADLTYTLEDAGDDDTSRMFLNKSPGFKITFNVLSSVAYETPRETGTSLNSSLILDWRAATKTWSPRIRDAVVFTPTITSPPPNPSELFPQGDAASVTSEAENIDSWGGFFNSIENVDVHSGSYAFRVGGNTAVSFQTASQSFSVNVGDEIEFRFWAKVTALDNQSISYSNLSPPSINTGVLGTTYTEFVYRATATDTNPTITFAAASGSPTSEFILIDTVTVTNLSL